MQMQGDHITAPEEEKLLFSPFAEHKKIMTYLSEFYVGASKKLMLAITRQKSFGKNAEMLVHIIMLRYIIIVVESKVPT